MASLLYGAGLRVLECARLRVKDVDFDRREIVVRDGKGLKDRVTLLPEALRAPLGKHIERVRRQHQQDLAEGLGSVELPTAIERKYPRAAWQWGWQWVFPATRFYRDPETGRPRRHHLPNPFSRGPPGWLSSRPASRSPPPATPCGIRLPPICWRMGTTSGRSRNSWGTAMSARP